MSLRAGGLAFSVLVVFDDVLRILRSFLVVYDVRTADTRLPDFEKRYDIDEDSQAPMSEYSRRRVAALGIRVFYVKTHAAPPDPTPAKYFRRAELMNSRREFIMTKEDALKQRNAISAQARCICARLH